MSNPPHKPLQLVAWCARRTAVLLAVVFTVFAPSASLAEPQQVPQTTTESAKPERVVVGIYVNDIQEVDFPTHSYAVDFYAWFRWKSPNLDPAKSMEFMNRYAPTEHQRDFLLDKPKAMPDGRLYSILREQGRFATKFNLSRYPFDHQALKIEIEDTLASSDDQVYVPDQVPVLLNPNITLPGFLVGKPTMKITDHTYPTNFGDLTVPSAESYSRVTIEIPITRALVTVTVKAFLPVLLIVVCALLIFFIMPSRVDGRIGLGITALLTLVALQLTASSSLPEVGYLMLIDKVYLASYAFIIAALARVVATSWSGEDGRSVEAVARADKVWAGILLAAYIISIALSAAWTFKMLPGI
ncbi:hypothetical protein [Hyphomicrobium sp.]|uniref:hypothetical protein n=1 Tax=Hyphomicrobium sp. TaxID=82 RepID=UPI002C065FB1|nr:hypothetical protein [Hyphomicrobium sp.]HVZ05457.1 hypothetical protein [Hyphomicrobium sp.]